MILKYQYYVKRARPCSCLTSCAVIGLVEWIVECIVLFVVRIHIAVLARVCSTYHEHTYITKACINTTCNNNCECRERVILCDLMFVCLRNTISFICDI